MAVVGNHCAMGGGGDGAGLVEGGLCSATHGPTTPPALAGLACTGQVGPTRCGTSTTSSSMTSSKRCCEGFAGGDWHGTLGKGHQHTLVFHTDNPVLKQLCQWDRAKLIAPLTPPPIPLFGPPLPALQPCVTNLPQDAESGGPSGGALFFQYYAPGQQAPSEEGGGITGVFGVVEADNTFPIIDAFTASMAQLTGKSVSQCSATSGVSVTAVRDCSYTQVNGRPGTG